MYRIEHTLMVNAPKVASIYKDLDSAEIALEGLSRVLADTLGRGVVGYGDRSLTYSRDGRLLFVAEVVACC